MVVWDLSRRCVVAVGRTQYRALAAAWLTATPQPEFVTAGHDGLMLWTILEDCMEQRLLPLAGELGQVGRAWGLGQWADW